MPIRVALHHKSNYRFDRSVGIAPHEIRLRPAPHCRTPILSYSLHVEPSDHFLNWQQDAYGNYIARLVFPEKAKTLSFSVDLVAEMTVINPFDFFVEQYAEKYPFAYPEQLAIELAPYLETEAPGPRLQTWLQQFKQNSQSLGLNIVDFLVLLNQSLQSDIRYLVRLEPGVQTPEETLSLASGSCRDSGWLLVQILRHLGLAARFVSGYLIQLTADVKAIDGPSGPTRDFTDLHAWAEVYLPGAGWIGLDPTSGLMAGEGHIPLACTAFPSSAAPVTGATDVCESTLEVTMSVTRIHEDPRVTKPYTDAQWHAIDGLGRQVDAELISQDVRLTQGGEPTFVSVDDVDGEEWNYTALSDEKWALAESLAAKLKAQYAPHGLLFYGQGKWYPGEPLPRWALGIYWRADGAPMWQDADRAQRSPDEKLPTISDAQRFMQALAARLGISERYVMPAFEDPFNVIKIEANLPINLDPLSVPMVEYSERARLAKLLQQGLAQPEGFVLPLKALAVSKDNEADSQWDTSVWPLKREQLFLLSGDSPLGYRLPLAALPERLPDDVDIEFDRDPFEERGELGDPKRAANKTNGSTRNPDKSPKAKEVVRTACCTQVRDGVLYVFMPPLKRLEDALNLIAAIENTSEALSLPLRVEGYPLPWDPRIKVLNITPDPGVIEVNIHPATSWQEIVATTEALYETTRQSRLATEKFMLDGRHTGTGGGNHITLGGAKPADSPFLRRPDLLKSLITYWQNHPALSYLFSGMFIGPTSQAPRVDEARNDNLYELEIAFEQMDLAWASTEESKRPWLVDRLLRHFLVDLTGNTHRAEFSIDKLYSPDGPTGRLGLVEFRAFEMPPHARMSLVQVLLLRALVARFWGTPYKARLVHWGTALHDRWMLPHFIAQDMRDIVRELQVAGYAFNNDWFAPFVEFRFPRYGTIVHDGIQLELRQAIEPWHVLGEEMTGSSTARYVDSSVERVQVKINGMTDTRHIVTCNGRHIPLTPTGVHGEFVAGVRYRAWKPPSGLHPTIEIHSPLVFDLVDTWNNRAIAGCTYHVVHPGGRSYETFPVNANEAEARRVARFWNHGHTPGPTEIVHEQINRNFPVTLDLRRQPA
jgi:uncharacterized protein (DUF2126 family)/transglutaminase-like putative cysteine protease